MLAFGIVQDVFVESAPLTVRREDLEYSKAFSLSLDEEEVGRVSVHIAELGCPGRLRFGHFEQTEGQVSQRQDYGMEGFDFIRGASTLRDVAEVVKLQCQESRKA